MTKPFVYQRKCSAQIEKFNGRALVALEMGTGKTFISLLWARRNPEARPILVICPASLKFTWEREAMVHVGMCSEVLQGTKVPSNGLLKPRQLIIINYDILHAWFDYLKDLDPQIIIVDEGQYCTNRHAKRTRLVKELCRGAPHVLILSGTPLVNRPSELWPLLNILRPDKYKAFHPFAEAYCQPRLKPWGWTYNGAANLGVLHKNLRRQMMIRLRKKDVLKELPDKRRIVVPIQIENPKEYTFAVKDFIQWLARRHGKGKARKAIKAEQMTKIGYLKRLAARLKLKAALEWVDCFLSGTTDQKIVLFAVHKPIITALHEKYKGKCVVVDGGVGPKDRQKAVDAFQHNKSIRVFIGNLQAAGVGITLTAASTVAFLEMGWTPGGHAQAEDRIHRISQKNVATIYYLVARGTIEEKLCEIIQKKQQVLEATLDGKGRGDTIDIYDQLEAELSK